MSQILRLAHIVALFAPAFAFLPPRNLLFHRTSHLRGLLDCKSCPVSSPFSPPSSLTLQTSLKGGAGTSNPAGERFLGVTINGNQTEGLEVCDVLEEQIGFWNAGDIDGFLMYYWQDERLTFTSNGAVRQGWNETKERYEAAYGGKGSGPGSMGFLRLMWEEVTVTVRSEETAWVLGKAGLTPKGKEEEAHMRFTLILRRIDSSPQRRGRWVIEHDHTSEIPSTPPPTRWSVHFLFATALLLFLCSASFLLSSLLARRQLRAGLCAVCRIRAGALKDDDQGCLMQSVRESSCNEGAVTVQGQWGTSRGGDVV